MAETLPAQEVVPPPGPDEALWPRSWRRARRVAIAALLLPWLLLGLIGLDGWLRGGRPERAAAAWMGCLGVSTPTLWPAGDPMHYPPEAAP
jgi:hypothetical protein